MSATRPSGAVPNIHVTRPGAAIAIGPWRYSLAGYDSVHDCAASWARPTVQPEPRKEYCAAVTSSSASSAVTASRASAMALVMSSPSEVRRKASTVVAKRVCTTDLSSAKESFTTSSTRSTRGVFGSPTRPTVRMRSRKQSSSSSSSVVVPERVIATITSYPRSTNASDAGNASVMPWPVDTRAAAYDCAMNQLVPHPTTATCSPEAGRSARSAVSPIACSHASGWEVSSASMHAPAWALWTCVSVMKGALLISWRPRGPPRLLLDGAGGQAADEVFLDEGEEDHDRDDRDDGPGEQLVPVLLIARDVRGDAHGERLLGVVEHQGQGDDVLVPGGNEGEDHGSHDTGQAQGQHDPHQGPEAAAAVEVG